jgi:sugar phosphate isomerase/epimerase
MPQFIHRRQFLRRSCQGALTLAALGVGGTSAVRAIEPFQRTGAPRLLPGLAAYSFRDFFLHASHERERRPQPAQQIDLHQFIDFCAQHGCIGAELTSYYFPPDTDDAFLLRLKRHAFLRGVEISGSAVGNRFTLPPGPARDREIASVKRWIDRAALMGAPHLRVFAGVAGDLTPKEARRLCLEALEECCDHAGKRGVMLGLENHGGIVAEAADLLELVQSVKSPWLGINLDTGNFHTTDPYADLSRCAPYAVNVQIKVEIQPRGKSKEPADLPRLLGMLRDAGYQGYVVLEYEAAEDPWTAVPEALRKLRELIKSA